ncbi:MAG: bifunctional glutamate N-acetyltransferase/amino-acid acetyltransferase ArgJ [Oscillospiraceae bacterium]|jgi:glutamate N-acetyltransferase/amino-acid N-acetyltransferase|nr:bifunctional glutamate N-acetyltransferase/amino-acid acetyltransferase ArgJ [Oscillospiraceae bacterium]
MFQVVPGGVTAAPGFMAAGLHCGIRRNQTKPDLALVLADRGCAAAAVYTTNRVQAAPIAVTRAHLADGRARAILANSGCANACAPDGLENARRACAAAAAALGLCETDIIVNSTGVIGVPLPIEAIEGALPALAGALSRAGGTDAALAIMTTDTRPKETAVTTEIDGRPVTVGGMAKGSGMIHPNMATMLAFLTTDCAIAPGPLRAALADSVRRTYNRVSVDGDTSTNDMTAVLASGAAGHPPIESPDDSRFALFLEALDAVNLTMARAIARDGEGATRLLVCRVHGADSEADAETLAKAVITSSLVKTALFGADANWGRVLCALGYAGAPLRPEAVEVAFLSTAGRVVVCRGGEGLPFDESLAKEILSQEEVTLEVGCGAGGCGAEAYGCDLSYDYVRINGDYRT